DSDAKPSISSNQMDGGFEGVLLESGDADVSGNTIKDFTTAGVEAIPFEAANAAGTLTGNTFQNNAFGVYATDSNTSDPYVPALTAHLNSIAGNTFGARSTVTGTTEDFTQNWWGAANGPSNAGTGSGDKVSVNLEFSPWCTLADCSDLAPKLSVANATVTEGDSGTSSMNFTVSLSVPASASVMFNYATSDGTAKAGSDYTAKTGSATIP